ncbi:MAG: hypothetical protein O7G85_15925 [Planctomycetota bacterium]|nr:hypothetical protein [Planctomycetota bacterium]
MPNSPSRRHDFLAGNFGGEQASVLDSGCCGLAGSFGYTKDNFDLSMKVFEQSLGESLRQDPEAQILATGTSCRHQIRDVTKRHARHPIERIAQSLGIDFNR